MVQKYECKKCGKPCKLEIDMGEEDYELVPTECVMGMGVGEWVKKEA